MASTHEERSKDFRSTYEWRVEPYRRGQESCMGQAVGFASLLVQGFMLLHGSALVAYPSLLKVIDVDFKANIGLIITLGIVLVVGLIAASLSGIFAFFALANGADGNMQMIEAVGHEAFAETFDAAEYEPRLTEAKQKAKEIEDRADVHFKWYGIWRVCGIAGIYISLAAFIVAAVLGFFAVMTIA